MVRRKAIKRRVKARTDGSGKLSHCGGRFHQQNQAESGRDHN